MLDLGFPMSARRFVLKVSCTEKQSEHLVLRVLLESVEIRRPAQVPSLPRTIGNIFRPGTMREIGQSRNPDICCGIDVLGRSTSACTCTLFAPNHPRSARTLLRHQTSLWMYKLMRNPGRRHGGSTYPFEPRLITLHRQGLGPYLDFLRLDKVVYKVALKQFATRLSGRRLEQPARLCLDQKQPHAHQQITVKDLCFLRPDKKFHG